MPRNTRNHAHSSRLQVPSQRRSIARRLLANLLRPEATAEPRRGLQLETLEGRQMLAGDVELFSTAGADTPVDQSVFQQGNAQAQGETAQGEAVQGEPSPDLVAFAKLLKDQGVVFYGADWCPHCTEQKELFEDGQFELPFVEVTDGSRNLNSVGQANGITDYPTWDFGANNRQIGVLTLDEISTFSGISIPLSESPTFVDVPNQSVAIGSPIHIPINAYDPDGQPLTVTATVADPDLLEAIVLQNNRSVRFNMAGYGDMVFELFEQRVDRPTSRMIELAEAGFYDGLTLHRILDNFVLQGGDPDGDGTGGSSLGNFSDQYHPDLQHTNTGLLSYAKSSDDTNDSQFFITEGNQQGLDFQHSIFGQLVEGEDVREGISRVAVNSAATGDPVRPVVIDSVTVFEDTENSVVMLRPTGNGTGTTNVTFTVTDTDGNSYSQIVPVTIGPDVSNAQPFLADIDPVVSPQGTPAQFQLESTDLEGDAVEYIVQVDSSDTSGATATVTAGGLVTVTPPTDFSGTVRLGVAVQPGAGAAAPSVPAQSPPIDIQFLDVTFTAGAPSGIDLVAGSDSGSSSTDNVTNQTPLTFTVSGVTAGSTVELLVGDTVVGIGAATSSTVTITTGNFETLGNGTYSVVARQRGSDGVNSPLSSPLTLVYDNIQPVAVTSQVGSHANVGTKFSANLGHAEEGSGLVYSLSNPPAGATIDSASGLIEWTPVESQIGSHTLSVVLTDRAGNTRSQSFDVSVAAAAVGEIILGVTDLDGNPITTISSGEEFLLTFSARDARPFTQLGVFAAYTDITFDNNLVSPVADNPIQAGDGFPNTVGSISAGLIDELGAFSDSFSGNGAEITLIATVRMRANQSGQATFIADPPDTNGTNFLLYDADERTPVEQVAFGSVSLQVEAAFTANDDSFTVAEDSTNNSLDVLDNDEVPTGSTTTLTLVSVGTPDSGGQATVNGGVIRYTPAADFSGAETFTYVVRDSSGAEQTATVTASVTPVNDPPTAVDDTRAVDADSSNNRLDVLTNDSSLPDSSETLTVTAVGTPTAGGTVTIESGGGAVLYTPATGFTGTDTFTYTISDGTLTSQATVTVNVATSNPPPTAVNDAFTVVEDAAEAELDVIANDTNSDTTETFSLTAVGQSSQGSTVRLSDDGTKVVYAPAANFFGSEQITYTITDSGGASATGTITVTVTSVNDPPPADAVTANIVKSGSPQTVFVIADAGTNVDGASETLTITAVGATASGGTATISGQTITYTPSSNAFTGSDSFTYTLTDGSGATATGTITVNVLDYQPRSFTVQLPSTNLTIPYQARLVGTTDFGEAVDVELSASGSANQVVFADQAPGSYRIEIPAMPFLIGGEEPQTIEITSAANDGNVVETLRELGSLRPEFMSIRDFVGSAPSQAVFAAVAPGQSSLFVLAADGQTELTAPSIALNTDASELTIEVSNSSGVRQTASAAVEDNAPHVEVRAISDEVRLIRVNLSSDVVTYTNASTAATATSDSSQGEFAQGESAQGESAQGESAQGQVPTVSLGNQQSANLDTPVEPSQLSLLAQQRTAAIDSAMADVATPGQQPTTAEAILTGTQDGAVDPAAVDDALTLLSDQA